MKHILEYVCYFSLKIKRKFLKKDSLICKSAIHDGRVAPWNRENCPVSIRTTSTKLSIFSSAFRNGILSAKFVLNLNFTYLFILFIKDQHQHYILVTFLLMIE